MILCPRTTWRAQGFLRGGTKSSNPSPSSGESGELPYCAAGLSRSRRTPARTAGRSLTYPALRRNAPCLAHSCAIYTRKSSEEGLEQEFNSLQAQREACEAFITSQRHEGWMCLRAGYDDFGGADIRRATRTGVRVAE